VIILTERLSKYSSTNGDEGNKLDLDQKDYGTQAPVSQVTRIVELWGVAGYSLRLSDLGNQDLPEALAGLLPGYRAPEKKEKKEPTPTEFNARNLKTWF
jgi:hypothetical protein